ncbi:hypothetical protein HDV03_005482 [Kappamyces sp. JEL0829]|nr:hypothetical protein HDV03_005482 [Kappamyces sp. JEL0829]
MGLVQDCVRKQDLGSIQKLQKEKGADFVKNYRDLKQNSILHLALEIGAGEIIEYAINLGVNVNAANIAGDSPLMVATRKGNLESVKQLIVAGSKVNHSNKHGNTALHYACFWRMNEIALYLTKIAGAYVKIANHYGMLPTDHTSKILAGTLLDIAKSQGDEVIRAQSLEDLTEGMDLMDVNAINDWSVEAEDIQIGEPMAETHFAHTFKGIWKGSPVAVKVPLFERDLSEQELLSIKSEITAIRKLKEPLLVPLLCSCTISPDVCFVTPYFEGGNLQTLLENSEYEISPQDAMKILVQVAKGLIHLHETKPSPLCHGNLKPSNILITPDGTLALSDYGFTKSIFSPRVLHERCWKSVEWLSPETLKGEDNLLAQDVYSFGLLVCAVATREPLFPSANPNPMVLGYLIASGLTPEIPSFIPGPLVHIMNQCWNPVPAERPSIRVLYNQLLAIKF